MTNNLSFGIKYVSRFALYDRFTKKKGAYFVRAYNCSYKHAIYQARNGEHHDPVCQHIMFCHQQSMMKWEMVFLA